jgi:hypothetical protein
LLTGLTLSVALLAPAAAFATETETIHFNGIDSHASANLRSGGPGTLTIVFSGVIHTTDLEDDTLHMTGTPTGTVTFVPKALSFCRDVGFIRVIPRVARGRCGRNSQGLWMPPCRTGRRTHHATRWDPFDNARHRFGVASESQTGCPSPADKKEKGKEVTHSLPLSMYTAPGGLRQGRDRAAQSTVRGQNPTDGSGEMMQGHAVVIAGRGPTGLVLAGDRPFTRGR